MAYTKFKQQFIHVACAEVTKDSPCFLGPGGTKIKSRVSKNDLFSL